MPLPGKDDGFTVKQVAEISGVSACARFISIMKTRLLKPARYSANGYKFYEEPQLPTLQQILFYREPGFQLKQIKVILGRADFEKVAALQSHRKVLQKNLARMRTLIETIDKTIEHLKGTKKMKSEEMFLGFSVDAGKTDSASTSNSAANRMIVRSLHRTLMAQCVSSSSPEEVPGRAISTTTRMSGSTSLMAQREAWQDY